MISDSSGGSVKNKRADMIPSRDEPKFGGLYLIIPLLLAISFATPVGDSVLRAFGVETTGVASFIACAIAGAVIGVAAYFVTNRVSRK